MLPARPGGAEGADLRSRRGAVARLGCWVRVRVRVRVRAWVRALACPWALDRPGAAVGSGSLRRRLPPAAGPRLEVAASAGFAPLEPPAQRAAGQSAGRETRVRRRRGRSAHRRRLAVALTRTTARNPVRTPTRTRFRTPIRISIWSRTAPAVLSALPCALPCALPSALPSAVALAAAVREAAQALTPRSRAPPPFPAAAGLRSGWAERRLAGPGSTPRPRCGARRSATARFDAAGRGCARGRATRQHRVAFSRGCQRLPCERFSGRGLRQRAAASRRSLAPRGPRAIDPWFSVVCGGHETSRGGRHCRRAVRRRWRDGSPLAPPLPPCAGSNASARKAALSRAAAPRSGRPRRRTRGGASRP